MAGLGELGAQPGRAPVLPHDGPVQRLSGRPVEGDQRLALVGDAEGGNRVAPLGQAGAELGQGGAHGLPDFRGVVLDPAGAGEVLGQLPVGDVAHPLLLVDGEGPDPGRAGIDGDDDPGHDELTLTLTQLFSVPTGGLGGLRAQTIANGP